MKIGLLIYGLLDTLSGGYFYDRKLVEYLRASGDTVEIISLPWRNYAAHLGDNLTFRLPRGLDLLIEDELNHPSLITANRPSRPYPVISLVHHLRCSEQRPAWQNAFYRSIERRYLHSVDGFIFNSKTTRDVVHALAGDDKPDIVAYPPTDRFGTGLPVGLIRSRAAESTPLRLLFLGNVIHRKGVHTLIEAVSQLGARVHLDVIGGMGVEPKYTNQINKMIGKYELSAIVQFHGALDNDELTEKLKQAHVLVVPSSYEGFGIVYLEGMAFGLPAIGTNAGAAPEVISDSETGYLIAPDDSKTLAARLSALADDRNLLAQLSVNALNRYTQQPTWEQTAGEIRNFLQYILNAK